jgi:hypothetical protein
MIKLYNDNPTKISTLPLHLQQYIQNINDPSFQILPQKLTYDQYIELITAFFHYYNGKNQYYPIIIYYHIGGWKVSLKDPYVKSGKFVGQNKHALYEQRSLKQTFYKKRKRHIQFGHANIFVTRAKGLSNKKRKKSAVGRRKKINESIL